MEDYRSKSYNYNGGKDLQIERYYGQIGPKRPHDFRSYSVSYASAYGNATIPEGNLDIVVAGNDYKLKKEKSTSKSWSFRDPEFQRKKRVASYKVYSVEGKVKGSFRMSFRWIKDKYTHVLYGW